MATERSLTSMKTSGSLDSESAQGAATPIVPVKSPQTRMSPPTFRRTPATSLLHQGRLAGPADDVALGDSIQADRAVREHARPCARPRRASRPAVSSTPGRSPAHPLVGSRSSSAHDDQSRVRASARGSNAPAVFADPEIASARELRTARERRFDDAAAPLLPARELAGRVVAVEDRGQSIDFTKHALFGGLGSRAALCANTQLERRAQHVFVKEREFGFRSGRGRGRSTRKEARSANPQAVDGRRSMVA